MSSYLTGKLFGSATGPINNNNNHPGKVNSNHLTTSPSTELPHHRRNCQTSPSKPPQNGLTNGDAVRIVTPRVVNGQIHSILRNSEHNKRQNHQPSHDDGAVVEAEEAVDAMANLNGFSTPKISNANLSTINSSSDSSSSSNNKSRGWFRSLFSGSSGSNGDTKVSPSSAASPPPTPRKVSFADETPTRSNGALHSPHSNTKMVARKLSTVSSLDGSNIDVPVDPLAPKKYKPNCNVELLHTMPLERTTGLDGCQLRLDAALPALLTKTVPANSGQTDPPQPPTTSPETSLKDLPSPTSLPSSTLPPSPPPPPFKFNSKLADWTVHNRTGALLFNKDGRSYYSGIAGTGLETILVRLMTENVLEASSSGSSSQRKTSGSNRNGNRPKYPTQYATPLTTACLAATDPTVLLARSSKSKQVDMSVFENSFREMIFGAIELKRSRRALNGDSIIDRDFYYWGEVGRMFAFKLHYIGPVELEDEARGAELVHRNDLYISSFVVHIEKDHAEPAHYGVAIVWLCPSRATVAPSPTSLVDLESSQRVDQSKCDKQSSSAQPFNLTMFDMLFSTPNLLMHHLAEFSRELFISGLKNVKDFRFSFERLRFRLNEFAHAVRLVNHLSDDEMMTTLAEMIIRYDNKNTCFFMSTLLSGLLSLAYKQNQFRIVVWSEREDKISEMTQLATVLNQFTFESLYEHNDGVVFDQDFNFQFVDPDKSARKLRSKPVNGRVVDAVALTELFAAESSGRPSMLPSCHQELLSPKAEPYTEDDQQEELQHEPPTTPKSMIDSSFMPIPGSSCSSTVSTVTAIQVQTANFVQPDHAATNNVDEYCGDQLSADYIDKGHDDAYDQQQQLMQQQHQASQQVTDQSKADRKSRDESIGYESLTESAISGTVSPINGDDYDEQNSQVNSTTQDAMRQLLNTSQTTDYFEYDGPIVRSNTSTTTASDEDTMSNGIGIPFGKLPSVAESVRRQSYFRGYVDLRFNKDSHQQLSSADSEPTESLPLSDVPIGRKTLERVDSVVMATSKEVMNELVKQVEAASNEPKSVIQFGGTGSSTNDEHKKRHESQSKPALTSPPPPPLPSIPTVTIEPSTSMNVLKLSKQPSTGFSSGKITVPFQRRLQVPPVAITRTPASVDAVQNCGWLQYPIVTCHHLDLVQTQVVYGCAPDSPTLRHPKMSDPRSHPDAYRISAASYQAICAKITAQQKRDQLAESVLLCNLDTFQVNILERGPTCNRERPPMISSAVTHLCESLAALKQASAPTSILRTFLTTQLTELLVKSQTLQRVVENDLDKLIDTECNIEQLADSIDHAKDNLAAKKHNSHTVGYRLEETNLREMQRMNSRLHKFREQLWGELIGDPIIGCYITCAGPKAKSELYRARPAESHLFLFSDYNMDRVFRQPLSTASAELGFDLSDIPVIIGLRKQFILSKRDLLDGIHGTFGARQLDWLFDDYPENAVNGLNGDYPEDDDQNDDEAVRAVGPSRRIQSLSNMRNPRICPLPHSILTFVRVDGDTAL